MSQEINPPLRKLKKANEVAASQASGCPPAALFDEFWHEGELAIMFGPPGVGKSLLAVDLAESLARGSRDIGLAMPRSGRNVLYVDLVLSEAQFSLRYSRDGRGGKRRSCKFSERLFRDRPEDGQDLAEWLRRVVVAERIGVVIIDDLSMVSPTCDGTRHALELMHELRRMTQDLGVAVLLLADSYPSVFGREASERDLRRGRVLCSFADSVFAMAAVDGTDRRLLWQTRTQSREIAWTAATPAEFELTAGDDGFVGFDLVEYEPSPEESRLICRIKRMHDDGESFRTIADQLAMSKSTVARLHAKWTPLLARDESPSRRPEPENAEAEAEPAEIPGAQDERLEPPADNAAAADNIDSQEETHPGTDDATPKMMRIEDLEREVDGYGRDIYIESRRENNNRPRVWYQKRPDTGCWVRHEHKPWYIALTHTGPTGLIPQSDNTT